MKMKMKMFHSDKISDEFFPEFLGLSGAKECKSCRSRKMLKNATIRPRWGEKNTATVCLSPQKNLLEAESWRQVSMDPVLLAPPNSKLDLAIYAAYIARMCIGSPYIGGKLISLFF